MLFKQPDPVITDALKFYGLKQSKIFMWYKTREVDPLVCNLFTSMRRYAPEKNSLAGLLLNAKSVSLQHIPRAEVTAQGDTLHKAMRATHALH
jgi:SRSO17 transposase